ncbi:hypothetical protein VTJ04DRAFT_8854 [Mycothermus thermophilus]|uniref:uncharacterized protein n=1 Tax=Humicola insolens TaxID=85995 RepID=UPI0037443FDD
MTLLPPVLHRSARAISVQEFVEAVQATCVHRFPRYHGYRAQNICLAVSGGVDSMALAFLTSKLKGLDNVKVGDSPIGKLHAVVVDHGLRPGSREEAEKVANVLDALDLHGEILAIPWKSLGPGVDPSNLSALETQARQQRYRVIAKYCIANRIISLFTAHHEDDQYETVLMRLCSGDHGYRGLQGMRAATDIPECYDMNGAYKSGFVDDQRRDQPFYKWGPARSELGGLRRRLRDLRWLDPNAQLPSPKLDTLALHPGYAAAYLDDYTAIAIGSKTAAPHLPPLETEDGGITIYRPLLSFPKERLIATCEENGIPWFEDHTNHDRTLTLRNALRHLVKNYSLPQAFQKPSVLQLMDRCRERVAAQEAQADRLLHRAHIHEFGPNAGTLVVTMPPISLPRVPRLSAASPIRRQKRLAHYRLIAALFLRRLLAVVTPERELSQPAQLGHLVSMVFPSLHFGEESKPPPEPKPYVICGVLFTPLFLNGDPPSAPSRWLLSRAPHVSNLPRPSVSFDALRFSVRSKKSALFWKAQPSDWSDSKLYDGRYWIRILHRLPVRIMVAPFEPEHHKPFRDALQDDSTRDDLAASLRRYAPGKVRYTLPAIYATQDVRGLLNGGEWWPPELAFDPRYPDTEQSIEEAANSVADARIEAPPPKKPPNLPTSDLTVEKLLGGGEGGTPPSRVKERIYQRLVWETAFLAKGETRVLLALPTLGIELPNLHRWLRYEVRYKKVDDEVLRLGRIGNFPFHETREKAQARVRRQCRRWRRWLYWKWRRARELRWKRRLGEKKKGRKEE